MSTETAEREVIVGSGEYRYRVVQNWAKLPAGWKFHDCAAVAVDSKDRVYVFSRGGHPLTVWDRDGNLLNSWGEKMFSPRPHGLHMGPDDTLYCTDDGNHAVWKCTLDGKILLELGIPGQPSGFMSGKPFNRCTHSALSPKGDIYVSDGYKNCSVHKFSPDGKLLKSWGASGSGPGEFNIPHNIACDDDGWVYVADRENHRIQVFDGDGRYETSIASHRPCALFVHRGAAPKMLIGELPASMAHIVMHPNLGADIKVSTTKGDVLCRIGDPLPGPDPGHFVAPHGLAVDSRGDIYVAEVSHTFWPQLYKEPIPEGLRSLHKLVKIP